MRRMLAIGVLVGSTLAVPAGTGAQQTCRLGTREYPENAVVCSGGLALYCSNGTWQSSGGERCIAAQEGDYLTPLRPFEEKSNEPIPEYYKEKYPWLNLQ